ncbi:MAG: hypothetical protein JL57_26180 [Desulfosporosinus sp. BICA1-9]|nr:MAG: hypothetical protein JL57_26180 [Desulfosporosinus sp. BICA1-9]
MIKLNRPRVKLLNQFITLRRGKRIEFSTILSGSMHVEQELQTIDTERLIKLPGIMKIQEAKPMK